MKLGDRFSCRIRHSPPLWASPSRALPRPKRALIWRCQSNEERSLFGRLLPETLVSLGDKVLPLGPCGGAALLEGLAVDEMAFELEVIVQAGMNRGEFLQ